MNKTIKIVLSIFVIIVVAIIVKTMFVGNGGKDQNTLSQSNDTTKLNIENIPSDWLTYTNKDLSLEIRYPKNLVPVYRDKANMVVFTEKGMNVRSQFQITKVFPGVKGNIDNAIHAFQQSMKDSGNASLSAIPENIVINGMKGIIYKDFNPTTSEVDLFKTESGGFVSWYNIWMTKYGSYGPEKDVINEQMLSTFKMLQ